MTRLPSIIAALAEPTRLGAIRLLWDGEEHCVCELMQLLGATQSRMSRHMSVLKAAGLVLDRRDAQWVRYRRHPKLDPAIKRMVAAIVRAADALDEPLSARNAA
jgi:ArsR family transcriptional regulator